ncbi:glycoside hydrolase family 13 protein [Nitriliruptoraceae bacterium ZYF776]|nr:glycoside hydrolase family 13 protein [Profundirhabdus halotolerans]
MSRDPLTDPHHDGSPAFVAAGTRAVAAPSLGDRVPVTVEVPHAAGVDEVVLRTTPDAEPTFAEARRGARGDAHATWHAEVPVEATTNGYRFLLAGPGGVRWLTQAGTHDHDVPDTWDFRLVAEPLPPPGWVADAVLYQVFPDRFARAGASDAYPDHAQRSAWDDPVATTWPATMHQFYGGDLPGIAARVDHLVDLGVTGIYLNPVFPSPESHRYRAASFDEVDPLLGGDEGLVQLAAQLHAHGLRVLGDLTLNHSGDTHPWFRRALADPTGVEAGFYAWKDAPGGDYHSWAGVPSLPKFDHRDAELRRRLYDGPGSVAARFLDAPFHLDGWRVDAANMAGRRGPDDRSAQLQRDLVATAAAVRDDVYLLAEHCHDATADLQGGGWHGTMDYSGFTRHAWSWLRDPDGEVDLLGQPLPLPRRPGPAVVRGIDLVRAQLPWRSVVHSLTLLGSHDTSRWATVAGDRDRRHVGLAWLLTFAGVPSIYYGDELGLAGRDTDAARVPMPWHDRDRWDDATLAWVRRLIALRHGSPALRRGGLRWVHVGDDHLAYVRHHPDERVLVSLTRDATEPVTLDAALLRAPDGARALLDHDDLPTRAGRLTLPGADGARARVWHLPT